MAPNLYFINPAVDFPTYFGGEFFAGNGWPAAEIVADLTLPSVAALAPSDYGVKLCNENTEAVDWETNCDFVAITGKVSQQGRMFAIADEFRRRGRKVILGGPFASLSPEVVRPHADILVTGEFEEIAPQVFDDLRRGSWQDHYQGTRPELDLCPIPRWDLYPNRRSLMGAVQTSRGCPFSCEFCDVIPYVGRKQRHKPIASVLAELDCLYQLGYRQVFFADDNFSASRAYVRELLEALRIWNQNRTQGHVGFMTELSIDAARDPDLLQAFAAAGLTKIYLGIETPNLEGLKETGKRQNLNGDLVELVHRFYEYGITIFAGMIVGFDADTSDVFEWQFQFAMESSIPIFTLGTLVAPDQTPLQARMKAEGRLINQSTSVTAAPWTTNVVPKNMSLQQMEQGMRWLATNLYAPQHFGRRIEKLVELLKPGPSHISFDPNWGGFHIPELKKQIWLALTRLARMGEAEANMLGQIRKALAKKPEATAKIMPMVLSYLQTRYMLNQGKFWDPNATHPRELNVV